jgi:hypothetical protein
LWVFGAGRVVGGSLTFTFNRGEQFARTTTKKWLGWGAVALLGRRGRVAGNPRLHARNNRQPSVHYLWRVGGVSPEWAHCTPVGGAGRGLGHGSGICGFTMVCPLALLRPPPPPWCPRPQSTASSDVAGDAKFMDRFSRQIGAFGVEMMAKVRVCWPGCELHHPSCA